MSNLNPERERETPSRFKEELLQATLQVLRQRRLRRKRLVVLGLAGCYLSGIVTALVLGPLNRDGPGGVERGHSKSRQTGIALDQERVDQTPAEKPRPRADAAAAASHFQSLRRLGDSYLDRADPEAAARCYRLALDYANAEEKLLDLLQGSWLLLALTRQEPSELMELRHGPDQDL